MIMTHEEIIILAKEAGIIDPSPYVGARENQLLALERFALLVVADFLQRTGQYVTNDASREAALEQARAEERTAIVALIEAGLDHAREAEADKASQAARGTDEELRLMRHWSDVRLWNSVHEKMAAAIRALEVKP